MFSMSSTLSVRSWPDQASGMVMTLIVPSSCHVRHHARWHRHSAGHSGRRAPFPICSGLREAFGGAGNQGPFGRNNTAGGGAGGQAGAGNADRLTAMSPGVSAGTRRHGTMSPVEETGDPAARAVRRRRRAGRVIVLDPEGRVLLFRYDE